MTEDEFIFAMDFEEVNNSIHKIVKKHLKNSNKYDYYNYNNYHNKYINPIKNRDRILSCSPSVSFTNYKPPPSSSYNEKLNNILKLYKEKNTKLN